MEPLSSSKVTSASTNSSAQSKVLVAIGFDDAAVTLLKSAWSVADRLGVELSVLHVTEYWIGRSWPSDGLMAVPMNGVVAAIEDQTVQQADAHLKSMIAKHLPNARVSHKVVLGLPVDEIRSHATKIQAQLIIVGGFERDYRFVPKGISTVLALQNESPCPVLILPKKLTLDWGNKRRLTAVLADDLSPEAVIGLEKGFEIAADFGNIDLKHVHVNGLVKEDLDTALAQVAAASHTPETAITGEKVWDNIMASITSTVDHRGRANKKSFEAKGGSVKTIILHGNPKDKISEFCESEQPDFIIFGRHKTWHKKPFGLGRMPTYSMFRSGVPVLIAD
ncbi:MAG: universal stress protein [Proteobacteria bacterium]|nr:universal stress protein [Pseudomonadota bacterium]